MIKHVGAQPTLRHPRKELAALVLKPGMAKALRRQLRMWIVLKPGMAKVLRQQLRMLRNKPLF
jgi:hypothetical protein